MCVYLHAGRTWKRVINTYDGAPFGKTRAHLTVIREAVAQTVETFGDGFARKACETLRTGIHLDAWDDALFGHDIGQWRTRRTFLVDSLILQDDTADELSDIRSGEKHFPIVASHIGCRFDL